MRLPSLNRISRAYGAVLAFLFVASIAATVAGVGRLYRIGFAHAAQGSVTPDPIVAATSMSDAGWQLVSEYGPLWGGILIAFGIATGLLQRNRVHNWIAQGRALASITGVASVLGALLEWRFHGASAAGVVVTAVMAVKLAIWPGLAPVSAPPENLSGKPEGEAPRSAVSQSSLLMFIGALVCAGAALSPTACVRAGQVVKHAVIDCTTADRPAIEHLITELFPLLSGEHPDWSAIESRAVTAGEVIGGCALAEVVQGYLAPPVGRAARSLERQQAQATLEDFRTRHAGGATWRMRTGDL